MDTQKTTNGLPQACHGFAIEGTYKDCISYGNGHINDTYLLTYEQNDQEHAYILQHMNKTIFTDPEALMENIIGVTGFLKEKIKAAGGNPRRETLDFVPAADGKPYYKDDFGEYWRAYHYIDHVYALDQVKNPEDFYQSALSFGHFQQMLADFPADTLHETIPDFHNTAVRFKTFEKAVTEDICGRAAGVMEEIQFVRQHSDLTCVLGDLQKQGKIPLRVTHNDTKSNNVLIDEATGKGLCVIDLDTVMPGLSVNDFGDSIRFGASTAAEDEKDLSRVSCSMELYEAYVKGFLKGCGGRLTDNEIAALPLGAKVMTYECGMRFLTDYLCGDTYFKIHRSEHNLDRARTQFKLVSDMENKWEEMQTIVKKYMTDTH